ncbi:flavodoxin family protein [Acidaminobacter sp. JC074]|uniref:flavodoxin family protein n=1 Tax=Acidaminobacter sp. JC074 TaxID=2530199 RepID=UPI001F114D0F|nr:flavodoxin family protein [Acidaminobacter sp. JC074]MCH4889233.1 flavodoxin family protein [Acidaminobacter sp. JC074]
MSKVILLSGSPNANGNTVQVFNEMAKVIEAEGLEAEVVSLAGMSIEDPMNFQGGYNDGFDEIIEKIKNAEGLIVGGPVYWGTVRSDMMAALQRIAMASMQDGNFLSRKVGGPIAVARRGGLTSTLQEMLMFFLSTDMIVPGSTYWNMVMGQGPGQALEDEEGMNTVKRFAENVAFTINKING